MISAYQCTQSARKGHGRFKIFLMKVVREVTLRCTAHPLANSLECGDLSQLSGFPPSHCLSEKGDWLPDVVESPLP
jgi:hypothetical protein